jgi:hemerythrin-like domain-containing protein
MQILREDHVNISKLLDVVESQIAGMRKGQQGSLQLLTVAMRYMTHYPDLFHHPLEDLVFDRLVAKGSVDPDTINQLIEEHGILRHSGREIFSQLKSSCGVLDNPKSVLMVSLWDYCALLRSHMDIEETVVFPLARTVLTDQDWFAIDDARKPVSDPMFGSDLKKGYLTLHRYVTKQTTEA